MANRLIRTFITLLITLALAPAAYAQGAPSATVRDALLTHWNDLGQKIIRLAEEFPADKYEFKPAEGVRTFGDQLRHVAFWNTFVAKTARGEKADGSLNELPRTEYNTKEKVVDVLRRTMNEAAGELKKLPATPLPGTVDLFTAFIGHTGEHYGQLVVYYRLNGLVPPASRGQ
jgi:uncharacterized damage-inducible protein DinB